MKIGREPARWALRSGALVFVTVVTVLTMLGGLTSAVHAQEPGTQQPPTEGAPVISAPVGPQTIGTKVLITGSGWARFTTLSAAVCGNRGISGSADCTSLGRSFFSQSDGAVVFEDVLARPPSPCPCVVRVRELEGGGEAKAPIEILGMEVPATTDPTVPVVAPGPAQLVVDQVRVVGGGWRSWFGLPSERTLEVVVSNRSATAVTRPPFGAAWGRGPNGANLIATPPMADVGPGETVTLSADFSTGPFATGTYEVNGRVGPPWAPAAFGSSFATWPWALLLLLVLAVVMAVMVVIAAGRGRRKAEPEATESLSSAPPPPADVIDLRDSVVPVPVAPSTPVDAGALEDDLADELGRVLATAGPLGPENHPELMAASVAAEVAAVIGARHHLAPEAVEAMAADLSESLTLELSSVASGPR